MTAIMRGNRKKDTRPEVGLRSALHGRGLRFRKDFPIPTGEGVVRVDIAFPRQRLVVFVDGCFWHSCPDHGNAPRANAAYWRIKLSRNVARDRAQEAALADLGWRVMRVWEHVSSHDAADDVADALRLEPQSSHRP